LKNSQRKKIKNGMMAIYEEKLSLWPVPYELTFIQTQYGDTHVVISGDPGNPALILLHGLAVTSMMWLPNIAFLSKHYRCFAVDVIGDHGKSKLSNPRIFPRSGKDYSMWLKDVYKGLELSEANLIGASNGGYVAINHALYVPEQVSKLILMAPSGIELTLKKVLPKIIHYLLFPSDENRRNLIKWFLGDERIVRDAFDQQMWLSMQLVPKLPIPIFISSSKLKKIRMPVLLILGENDPTLTAKKAVSRISTNTISAESVIVPEVGHVLNYEAEEIIGDLILGFL
jgi:pimeloyl-ACP methyl ester carboxylesterase